MAGIIGPRVTIPIIQQGRFGPLHSEYDVIIGGQNILVTVTWSDVIVSEWIIDVDANRNDGPRGQRIVGFGAWYPPHYDRPISTIYFCIGTKCLVYRIGLAAPNLIPESLSSFLGDKFNLFVGVNLQAKFRNLQNCYGLGCDSRMMDLGIAMAAQHLQTNLETASLRFLAHVVTGSTFIQPMAVKISNWNDVFLTPANVLYSAVKGYMAFEIGSILESRHSDVVSLYVTITHSGAFEDI